ncbi:MAG: tyrosine--tRNA ligase [Spirochaetia bacterium]|nr:tyrosine--tRNA ligase [Spirochaetia bacterium]
MSETDEQKVIFPDALESAFLEISRGCEEILPLYDFRAKLLKSHNTGIPLKIKAGFDPTAPDLHLGHTVLLQKLKVFQQLGHTVYFLIGDYTAMIGDPTGKSETRKPLSQEDILINSETYKNQVFKILSPEKTKVVFNSQWLKTLNLKDIISLTAKYTVARLIERDDFSKRYEGGQAISLVEFLYPLLQGYDSVAMETDVELGGTDQKFNLLVGRDLQTQYNKTPQSIITLPLLVGLDGEKKMSKSLGNYIGIQEAPIEIFGKLMSISDNLMWNYYELLSGLSVDEIKNLRQKVNDGHLHPKDAKKNLASEITARFSDEQTANEAISQWEKIHNVENRGLPDDIPVFKPPAESLTDNKIGILNALRLSGMVASNGEAKRLIQSGGVYKFLDGMDFETVSDEKLILGAGKHLFRTGKRKFVIIEI